jgi:hypothetical protein
LLNVYDPKGFSEGRKIAVSVFEVGGAGVGSNAGPLEKPRDILLDRFQKALKKTKYFSDVSVVAPDATSDAEYVLEGNLIGLSGGSRLGRYFVGGFGNAGQMRVSGQILGPAKRQADNASRPVLSDWECDVFNAGQNPFALFGESNAKIAKENAEGVASALSFEMKHLLRGEEGKTELDKMERKAESDSEKGAITGSSEHVNRSWREKQEWETADYGKEIESFIVRSHEEKSRGVDVLWLTHASYQAHAKLIPSLKQTAILKSQLIKPGMLTDIEAVKPFAGQDVIVLVASYTAKSTVTPLLWDSKRIRSETYLMRRGNSGQKIAPSEFLDDKIASYIVFHEKTILKGLSDFRAFHPVILVFPAKLPDGTPLLMSTTDSVEFHTEVDGRPVQIDFNLKDFDLRNLDDLKMVLPGDQQ